MKDKRFRYLPSQMNKLESGKAETGLSMGSTTENTIQKESKRRTVESKIRAEQQIKRDEPSEGSDRKAKRLKKANKTRLHESSVCQRTQQGAAPQEPSGILEWYRAPPTTDTRISTALDPTRTFPEGTMAAVRGTESVDMYSFQRLAPETWLNDQVMNYVAKQVIQPATRNTFYYSSYSSILDVLCKRRVKKNDECQNVFLVAGWITCLAT